MTARHLATRPLARPIVLDLEAFARLGRVHPDLVRRLVALGLLDPFRDASGRLWFPYSDLAVMARIQRLRAAVASSALRAAVSAAASAIAELVTDLLDRIADLESAPPSSGASEGD